MRLGEFKIGRIAVERQPHLTNRVVGDPNISDQDWARREGMVAFAGYPLAVGDQVVGVMALFARHPLLETTLGMLGSVADEIALGIARAWADDERARLLRREQAAREEIETIHRVSRRLSAELDRDKLAQTVTDAATTLTGAAFGAFFYNVVNEHGEAYMLHALSGKAKDAFAGFPMPRNTSIFGPTFRGEGVVRLDDVREHPRFGANPPYHGLPSGHPLVVSYLAVPVAARSGEVLGGLFFGHPDRGRFTEREERIVVGLAAQAAIAMDNAHLFQQTQNALRLRDHFLAAVAHDLRTPLTMVKGGTQLLQRQAARDAGLSPERLATGLAALDTAATKMAKLIDQLLDLARTQTGGSLEIDRRPTDLVALARQVAAEHQKGAEQHRIVVRAASPEVIGWWDPTRLERVLDNLLSNAIKYSPAGGDVTVTVTREGTDNEAWVELAVRDEGVGVPAADLERIFDRFHRGGNVEVQVPGIGLGLASTSQIVATHGGKIRVESREGKGSTFIVRLPLSEPRGDLIGSRPAGNG
jgi:signal transduction histidine kinase